MGGTSTNASLTIDGLRFYEEAAPQLEMARNARSNTLTLSWPISASDYGLQSSESLSDSPWQPVGQQTRVLDFRYQIEIPTTNNAGYYRLMRP